MSSHVIGIDIDVYTAFAVIFNILCLEVDIDVYTAFAVIFNILCLEVAYDSTWTTLS